VRKPKAAYITSRFDLIYGPEEQAAIAERVELLAPPQTPEAVADLPAWLGEVEVIFSGWGATVLDAAFLAACPKLEAFFYGAGSVRAFVTDAFWEKGIHLSSAWAANAVPVAEYAHAAILLSLKRFWAFGQAVRQDRAYPNKEAFGVAGAYRSTVGLCSLGMIGRMMAERLARHDLRVIAYDPYVDQDAGAKLGVEMVSLETLFAQADVVSLHTPWLPETVGLITGELVASMKPNATLINTSRGAVVDEEAMLDVLAARPDLWAVLDVVWPEPPSPESRLFDLPNVILTPHIAGSMGTECHRMGQYMIEELDRYLAGEPLNWELTREKAAIMA